MPEHAVVIDVRCIALVLSADWQVKCNRCSLIAYSLATPHGYHA